MSSNGDTNDNTDRIIPLRSVRAYQAAATANDRGPGQPALRPPHNPLNSHPNAEEPLRHDDTSDRGSSQDDQVIRTNIVQPKIRRTRLARELKERHVNMIAFSTVVGVGLFLQNGRVIYLAGPGMAFLIYLSMTLVIGAVMGSLGEMTALFPVPGALFELPARFLDESIGYAAGWMAWFSWVVIFAAELNSIAALFQFRFEPSYLQDINYPVHTLQWTTYGFNPAIWITAFWFLSIAVNFLPVKLYGEVEYGIGICKMLFLVGLILFQLVINLQSGLGTTYYCDPYTFVTQSFTNWKNITYFGSTAQLAGVWSGLTVAVYSLIGFESICISAAESVEFGEGREFAEKEGLRISTRKMGIRILLLYTLSTAVVSFNVPADDPNLVDAAIQSLGGSRHSAFVIAAVRAGKAFWPGFMTGFFVLSATSAAINSLYLSSRLLHALALSRPVWPDSPLAGAAREWLEQVTERGVPRNAIFVSSIFGGLGYLSCGAAPSRYLGRLAINSTVSMLIVYIVVCVTFLRFKSIIHNAIGSAQSNQPENQHADAQSFNRESSLTYPYKSRWQPLRAFLAGLICTSIVVLGGWRTISPFRIADFLACYISVFIFCIIWLLYRVRALRQAGTRFWRLHPTRILDDPTRVQRAPGNPGRDHLNLDIDHLWTSKNAMRFGKWIWVWCK